jgi:hypothetical protein
MTRRHSVLIACVVFVAVLSTMTHARSEPPRYRLEFKPIAPSEPAMRSTVIFCSQLVTCSGDLELLIDGARRPVIAVAQVGRAAVIVGFESEGIRLSLWKPRSGVIELGPSSDARQTIELAEPTGIAAEDDGPLYHRPVVRTPPPRIVARVRVDIRPSD